MVGKTIIWGLVSLACGGLYHIAGIGGFKGSKAIRRFGCSLLFLGLFLALRGSQGFRMAFILSYALTYILNAIALSTYHDYLAPDGTSENWLCWLATGFFYGLSAFPLVWCGVHW